MKIDNLGRRALLIGMMLFTAIAPKGQNSATSVLIRAMKATVKNNEGFLVSTIIRNLGRDERSFQIWSCSYPDNWTANNSFVHIIPAECKKNDVIRVGLEPGKAYERDLSIRIGIDADRQPQKMVSFRLGFEPITSESAGTASRIWSNAIVLHVTR